MDRKLTITQHLGELRIRILLSLGAFLIGAIMVYVNMNRVMMWLLAPIMGRELHFTGPADGFFVILQIAVVGGIVLSLPVWLYQILAFIFPGCTPREKKVIVKSIGPAVILFLVGAIFGEMVLFPLALRFMLDIGDGYLDPMMLGDKYFSFLLLLTVAMGLFFQLPIVTAVLGKLGILSSGKLRTKRIRGYLGIAIFVGILIPAPDPMTLALVCLPVVLLYELSIWMMVLMEGRSRREAIAGDV